MVLDFKQLLTRDKRGIRPPECNFLPGNSVKTPYANGKIGILRGRITLRLIESDSIGWLFRDNIELKYGPIQILFALDPKIQVDVQTLK